MNVDRERTRRYVAVIASLAGVFVVTLSAVEGNLGTILLGGFASLVGLLVYVGIGRYGEQLSQFRESTVDYTTGPAFAYSLVQIVGLSVLFASMLYIAVSTDFVTTSIADVRSAPTWEIGIGVVPGIVLGAGFPVFIQHQTIVSRLNVARIAFALDYNLSIGTYVLLLVSPVPAAAVFYAIALLVSRLVSLGTIFGGDRRRTTSL